MLGFFTSRLISAAIVILGVCCIVFLFIHLIPGDPIEVMLGESAQPADREALRHALGLDQPIGQQLLHYLQGLARFDLGQSLHSHRPINEMLLERIPATAELAVAGLAVAVLLSFPLSILRGTTAPWDSPCWAYPFRISSWGRC